MSWLCVVTVCWDGASCCRGYVGGMALRRDSSSRDLGCAGGAAGGGSSDVEARVADAAPVMHPKPHKTNRLMFNASQPYMEIPAKSLANTFGNNVGQKFGDCSRND